MSIIGTLNTTKLALSSFQAAIDITGSNISNVNTAGYSLQRPVLSSVGTIDVRSATVQVGVEVSDVERVYNNFLRDQINERTSITGYYEALSTSLESVEIIFDETSSSGLNDLLNQFWNSWSDVSNNPEGQVERDALISAAESLCTSINDYGNALDAVREDAQNNIQDTITEINSLTSSIADINGKIRETGSEQGNSNILQDKRDEYLKQLCSTMNVSYFTDSDGALNIFLPNGEPLVEKEFSWELQLSSETSATSPPYHNIVKVGANDSLDEVITGGKIGALLDVRDTVVKGYQDKLNSFASALATEVNEKHESGYDQYYNVGTSFFGPEGTDPESIDAKSISVNSDLINDIKKIAASSTILGDGSNANLISAIKDNTSIEGFTFNNYSASIIGKIGQDVADAKTNVKHQDIVMSQLVNQRESVSGVSIDEEMMKLIQYQMGYNAAGRLCTIVNEMLDTLINLGK